MRESRFARKSRSEDHHPANLRERCRGREFALVDVPVVRFLMRCKEGGCSIGGMCASGFIAGALRERTEKASNADRVELVGTAQRSVFRRREISQLDFRMCRVGLYSLSNRHTLSTRLALPSAIGNALDY
jgi:hypothetical protein